MSPYFKKKLLKFSNRNIFGRLLISTQVNGRE